jgi:hypothetical protein
MDCDELKVYIGTVIKEAQALLSQNTEWVDRYNAYTESLIENINSGSLSLLKQEFNEYPPLRFYISTTNAKKKNVLSLDIRYLGQSVATLTANPTNIIISTKDKEEKNARDFGCNIILNDEKWISPKAKQFRIFFRDKVPDKKHNHESNVENLLLEEFSKTSSDNKAILHIQPVKIFDIRYAMPTPISASNPKKLKYAGSKGGGIDLFARTGKKPYLTIIEIKDENTQKEPPLDALKQAIQYAIFIRELLRSDKGQTWYHIFGFSGLLPKKLKIRVACAMPDDFADTSFANKTYAVGNDEIECHYIYFKYDGQSLSDFQTSLR